MTDRAREDRAIEAWRTTIEGIEEAPLTFVGRPDRDRPGSGGCDALISGRGVTYAVEHTTIDAFLEQRKDDDRFSRVVVPLQDSIAREFPESLVHIYVAAGSIPVGEDWDGLRQRLFQRIRFALNEMSPDGAYRRFSRFDFDNIPFPVLLSRSRPIHQPGCLVGRSVPVGHQEQLVEDIGRALNAKTRTLSNYRSIGRTVLLLDFDDISLLNDELVATSFRQAVGSWSTPQVIDDVYTVDGNQGSGHWVLPIKLRERLYPDLREYEMFRERHYQWTYG